MNRFVLVIAVFAIALCGVAFMLLRGDGEAGRTSTPRLGRLERSATDTDPVTPSPPDRNPAQPIPMDGETRKSEIGTSLGAPSARKFAMDVHVVDEDLETPIAGAQVHLRGTRNERGDAAETTPSLPIERATDPLGFAHFGALPLTTVEVLVIASGFAPVRREVGVGAYDRVETIRMSAKGIVVGRTVDASGHPIAGALVTLLLEGESAAASTDRVAQSDPAGEFEFRAIDLKGEAAMNARLIAQHFDYSDRPERSLALLRATQVRAADLVFDKLDPMLRGRVLSAQNELLSGLTVHLSGPFGEREVTTDKAGRFEARVGVGAVALTIEDRCIRNPGYFDSLAIAEGRDLDIGDVVVDSPTLVLLGVVRFDDEFRGKARGVQLVLGRSFTTTDPDGLFRLELCDVASGGFVANWMNRDGQTWSQDLAQPNFDSSDLEIVLCEHGIVVEAREDGKAIDERATMTVSWRLEEGRSEGKDSGPAFGTPLKFSRGARGKLTGTLEIKGFSPATFEHQLVPSDFDVATTITVAVRRS